jgi:hypothetical protein
LQLDEIASMNMHHNDLASSAAPATSSVLAVISAIFLAILAGLVASVLPWLYTLLVVFLIVVLVASAAQPHIGLIVALMLIFEVVPSIFQPHVPGLAGGRLQIYDLLIAYLAAIVLMRVLAKQQRPFQAMGPIRWPLYYLAACLFSSLFYVQFFAPNVQALAEARFAIAWLIVPLIALSADTPSRFRWFVRSVLTIGVVIALYVTIQSAFDVKIMTGSRVESLDPTSNSDVVRSIAGGGIYIVIFALLLLINRMLERRLSWQWGTPILLLLVAGLAVQFGRGVWIATAAGLLISSAMFRGVYGFARTLIVAAIAVVLIVGVTAMVKPRMAEALITRATSVGDEFESGQSYNWRKIENDAAMRNIQQNPILGTGIGGDYKRSTNSFQFETTYIYNSYLFFPLKMGLFSIFIPLAFSFAFFVTVRQGVVKHRDGNADRAFVAALFGAFTVPIITSVTQPEWANTQGTAAYAIFTGLALLYRQMGSPLTVVTEPAL